MFDVIFDVFFTVYFIGLVPLNLTPPLFSLHFSEYDKLLKNPSAVLVIFSNIEPVLALSCVLLLVIQ